VTHLLLPIYLEGSNDFFGTVKSAFVDINFIHSILNSTQS